MTETRRILFLYILFYFIFQGALSDALRLLAECSPNVLGKYGVNHGQMPKRSNLEN